MNSEPVSASKLLFIGVGFLLLLHFWHGWRAGFLRQIGGILAIALAVVAALFGRGMLVPFLRPFGLPDRHLSFIAGAVLFLGVYILTGILTGLFFKNTAGHESGIARLGHGFLGGLIGLAKGLFVVWVLFVGLRVVGTFAELNISLHSTPPPDDDGTRAVRTSEAPGPLLYSLAEIKTALDSGPVGAVMNVLDPVPDAFSKTMPKLVRVLGDEDARARFVQAPGMQKIVRHPAFDAVLRDPAIAKAAATKDFKAIMQSRALQTALEDEDLRAAFKEANIGEALDFALAGAGPAPAER